MNKDKNHYNAYFRLALDISSIVILLLSANFSELDKAYYITSLVLNFQFIINTLELMENEVDPLRYTASIVSLVSGTIGFLLFLNVFLRNSSQTVNVYGNIAYHCLVSILLVVTYFPNFLTWVMFFENKFKIIGKQSS